MMVLLMYWPLHGLCCSFILFVLQNIYVMLVSYLIFKSWSVKQYITEQTLCFPLRRSLNASHVFFMQMSVASSQLFPVIPHKLLFACLLHQNLTVEWFVLTTQLTLESYRILIDLSLVKCILQRHWSIGWMLCGIWANHGLEKWTMLTTCKSWKRCITL